MQMMRHPRTRPGVPSPRRGRRVPGHAFLASCLFLAALLPAAAARADDAPAPAAVQSERSPVPSAADPWVWSDQSNQRALNGHYFLPSQVVADPFTGTHFGSSTAFGYGRFKAVLQNDDGTTQNITLKVIAIQQGLDLQVGLGAAGPASFAIRARAAGSALVGINADSALYLPLTVGYDFGVGFLAKPWGNRYFQFGLSFDFDRTTSYQVSPLTALRNSVAQGSLTSDGLLSKVNTTDLYPGLELAVSPYKVIGLTTSLRYDWSHVDGGATDHLVNWGVALSLDLNPALSAPIGLQGVYQLVKSFTGTEDLQHYGGGGIFYTGRKDLALGVEVVTTTSSANGMDQLLILGQFRLRYYW